jgi:hypothetical protein
MRIGFSTSDPRLAKSDMQYLSHPGECLMKLLSDPV